MKLHCPQTITSMSLKFDLSFKEQKRVRQVFKFKKGNFYYLQESLTRVPFDGAYSDHKNEHLFKDLFLTALKHHISVKTVHDTYSCPWMNGTVHLLIGKK